MSISRGDKVAVSVINNTGYRNIGSQIEDRAIQSLRGRGVGVVERAMLEQIMREKQISMIFDNTADQVELGRLAGADYMMLIRVDKPKVEKKTFRQGGKQYEKLQSLTVSVSIKTISVADATIADMKVSTGSRSGLSDKTYDDLPAETVEAAASAISKYISPPAPRRSGTSSKSEIPTWGYVVGGVVVVGALVYLASTYEASKKCLEKKCLKEECAETDASGNCIEWKCVEEECVRYEEDEDSNAAPALHQTTSNPYFHQEAKSTSWFQLSRNFEIRIKLFEWRF